MYAFDFDEAKGLGFIVMELGLYDLEKYFQRTGRPQPPERKMIWRQLVDISSALHSRNIVWTTSRRIHSDVSHCRHRLGSSGYQTNEFNRLSWSTDQTHWFGYRQEKLHSQVHLFHGDKGSPRNSSSSSACRGGRNGTMPYSAPEVVGIGTSAYGINTTKCDVWSWGAILYRMAYSRPPDYPNPHRPAFKPPPGVQPSHDPNLLDILQHTLVDLAHRPSPPWLASHRFTIR